MNIFNRVWSHFWGYVGGLALAYSFFVYEHNALTTWNVVYVLLIAAGAALIAAFIGVDPMYKSYKEGYEEGYTDGYSDGNQ